MQRVLIVEDDADLVETYTDLLEAHDYSVTATARAIDAITLVTKVKPSIVLLDLNLAGHSGTVVINVIRGYQLLRDTKIIVVTGHPELLKDSTLNLSVDLILSKPVSNEHLLRAIQQCGTSRV